MSILNQHRGSYDARGMIEIFGSFLVNGTSDPDGLRDGKTSLFTVERDSAGLFTVTIASGFPIPERLVVQFAQCHPPSTTIGVVSKCDIVEGSYSQSARTFQILCTTVADAAGSAYADPAAGDPIDNSRICFLLKGSIDSAGTDAA